MGFRAFNGLERLTSHSLKELARWKLIQLAFKSENFAVAAVMDAAIRTIYLDAPMPPSDRWLKDMIISMWSLGGPSLKRGLKQNPDSLSKLTADVPEFMIDLAEHSLESESCIVFWQCKDCHRPMWAERNAVQNTMNCQGCDCDQVRESMI